MGSNSSEIVYRTPVGEDFDWIVDAHREIYTREYGWTLEFVSLVQEIVFNFSKSHDPTCERGWIAEKNGERLGCVLIVKESTDTAKLRVLLVDPQGRGLGIGTRLVQNCISFAKKVGYKKMVLWTHPELISARKIYQANGFDLLREEMDSVLGKAQIFQYWSKDL